LKDLKTLIELVTRVFIHGHPQGRARGGTCPPPWPAKIVCFSTFKKENSIFLGPESKMFVKIAL